MKFLAKASAALLALLPVLALAQGEMGEATTLVANLMAFMNGVLVPFVFALAFLIFIWGMFKAFILGGSDEAAQSQGKSLMLYAVIGFVVMISIWGIVNLLVSSFGLGAADVTITPVLPQTR
jgi:Type IV secretion system pilin